MGTRFVYGTTKQAKICFMREMLAPLDVEIAGLGLPAGALPEIDESGNDPLENAVIKAHAYYSVLEAPVFSCDSGLFIEGLAAHLQPGVHVRTVAGKHLDDDGMLAHYAGLAKKCGGQCVARYCNGICLVYDENRSYRHMGDDIAGERFLLASAPHGKRVEGFPLDSLSVHIGSGKYYYDMEEARASSMATGFVRFFEGVLRDLALE